MMFPGFDAVQGRVGGLLGSVRENNEDFEVDAASAALRSLARAKGARYIANSIEASGNADADAIRGSATANLIGSGISALGNIAGSAIRSAMADSSKTDKFSADYGRKIDRYSEPLSPSLQVWDW